MKTTSQSPSLYEVPVTCNLDSRRPSSDNMATTAEDSNSFSSAIQFWKSANLPNLQKELDQQGLTIVENQKDGLISRKKLAEQTREFKKIPDEEKLQHFKVLLKGYQSEIDNITRRTKFSENAFLTVYKILADAPDPAPLFEAALDQSIKILDQHSTVEDNEKLRAELEESRQEIARLKQFENANKELQQKIIKLENAVDEKKSQETAQREQEMKMQYNDKIRSYKEREHDLQRQLNQALDQLTQLRHTHEDTQAQLISHNQKYDGEVVGKLAELDIVSMDLERANARIVELERKNVDLQEEIQTLQHQSGAEEANVESPDAIHDAEISKLIKDIETYKDLYQKTETRLSKKIKELTDETKALTEETERLKKKLKGFEDYDEIKRELEIMKYVEFSTGEDDEEEKFDAKDLLNEDQKLRDSLEVRLMEKNKKLENKYTQIKISLSDLQHDLELKTTACEQLKVQAEEQTALIQKLEEDLLRLGQKADAEHSLTDVLARTPSPTGFTAAPGSHTPRSPDLNSPRVSYDASSSTSTKDNKSILPIVISQRDRFRQRNSELEERTRELESTLQNIQGELEGLRADNLKLYERLKFVHVWKEEQTRGLVNRSTTVNMSNGEESSASPYRHVRKASEDPTDKYGKLYEENMNPFMQFHRKEETRRYNAMNPADKLSYNITRMLFSHRWSRYFLIIYSLLLHLLVVVTLYQLNLWECRHDHETSNLPIDPDMAGKIVLDNP
ncbi:hypothetical protein EC973_005036 [Apophysomyces ossiformis]|uniref:Protein CASP n=1 Tax=Apophysomyces ossiformis TaxID=679940 RepID=A0A8H7ER41_9FUNG|nr:hypothetical protein EC973_005036 [Apophysomyces ossiformis]